MARRRGQLLEMKQAEENRLIHALGKVINAEVLPRLLACFRDRESCVRLAAAEVLARRADPALAPDFLRLLADPNFEVRLSAVQFLGRMRDAQTAQALLPLLTDADSDVRRAVAQALGVIGEPAAIEALVLALTDEERAVRQAADQLGEIRRRLERRGEASFLIGSVVSGSGVRYEA